MNGIALIAALSGLLLAGSAAAQVQPAKLEVVDSVGNRITPVLEEGDGRLVLALLVDSHPVRAMVGRTYLYSAYGNAVFFASWDCSGQAFTRWAPEGSLGEPFAIVRMVNSVYAGPRASQQSIFYNSHLDPGINECQVGTATGVPNPLTEAVPVSFVRDLSPPFQPPFDIRAVAASGVASAPAVGLVGLIILGTLLAFIAERLLRRVG